MMIHDGEVCLNVPPYIIAPFIRHFIQPLTSLLSGLA